MIDFRPFDRGRRQTQVLKHADKINEDDDHRDQAVVLRRQEPRQRDCRGGANYKPQRLGRNGHGAAAREPPRQIVL